MIEICQTCGSDGFDVALIYCEKCQVYPVHRYCLKEMPKTFDEYVIWYCEDCEPTVETKPENCEPTVETKPEDCEPTVETKPEVNLKKNKSVRTSRKKKSKKRRKAVNNSETPPPLQVIEIHDTGDCEDTELEGSQDKTLAPEAQPEKKIEKRILPARKSKKRRMDITGSKTSSLTIQEIEVEGKENCGDTELEGSQDKTLDPEAQPEKNIEKRILPARKSKKRRMDITGSKTSSLPIQEIGVEDKDNCGDTELKTLAPEAQPEKKIEKQMMPARKSKKRKDVSGSKTTNLPIQEVEVEEDKDSCGDTEVGLESTTLSIPLNEVEGRDNYGDKETGSKPTTLPIQVNEVEDRDNCGDTEVGSETTTLPTQVNEVEGRDNYGDKEVGSELMTVPIQVIEVQEMDNCGGTEGRGSEERMLLPETQQQNVSRKRKLPRKSEKKKSKKRKKDASSSDTTTPLQVIEVHDRDNCGDTGLGGNQEKKLPLEKGTYTEKGLESAKTSELAINNDPSNLLQLDCNVTAPPIIDPIWRGSLSFWNDKFDAVDGLVAHLSCLACFKVYMQAKLLPDLLSTELLPRCDVWPKGFEKWGPGDHSIALYFFPGNERYGKVFDDLVDTMICKDLAMRVMVENAELLVFASTVLPMPYWKFGGKSYLWGVFRGTSNTTTSGEGKDTPVKALNWCSRSPVPLSNSASTLTSH